MTNDDKIREEILQYVINREGANKSALSYGKIRCVKRVHIRSYSGPPFSRIRNECGDILRISPCSYRIRENAGKMRTRITPNTTLFTQ